MTHSVQIQKFAHSPTLNTILMVENALRKSANSAITIAELKRKLPKQVNHNTLKLILEYLETSKRIFVSLKGITWLENANPNLRKAIGNGIEF